MPDALNCAVAMICVATIAASSNAHAQRTQNTSAKATLDSSQFSVLRDLLQPTGTRNWNVSGKTLCVDPNVALFPDANKEGPVEVWAEAALVAILRLPSVAIDSAVGAVPRGGAKCTRTFSTARLAYGRPRVFGDSGAVVFIVTRMNSHAEPDSQMFDFQLTRRTGKWTVPHWLQFRETVHTYIRGEGCYRLSHKPFVEGIRVDTVLIRADTTITDPRGRYTATSEHRLRPEPAQVGMPGQTMFGPPISKWYATNDSLHFEWFTENSMLYVSLLLAGDSVRGTMTHSSDAIVPNPPTIAVTGKRVSCN